MVSEPATSERPAETWMSASVKRARRLAEGEGHNRAGVAVAQRAVDDVDRDGRILGVDRDGVRARAAQVEGRVGVAACRNRNRGVPVKPSVRRHRRL